MSFAILLKLIICSVIIPFFIGFIFTRKINEESNIVLAIVIGNLIMFALLEILAIPMIWLENSFYMLINTYVGILLVGFIISIIINRKQYVNCIKNISEKVKELPIVSTLVVLILISIQCMGLYLYMHENADDAFFIGTATTTIKTNTLYKYSPATETESYDDHLSLRYRLAPFPLFNAILSVVLNVEPAQCAHTIIPLILIPLAYMIYYLISKELFKNDVKKTMLFMVFLNIIIMFSGYSTRPNYSYFLTRIWQGKAVLGNIIIPSIWLFFVLTQKNGYKFINYLLLLIVIFAGNLTSSMGVVLPTMSLLLLGFIDEVTKINVENIKNKKVLKEIISFIINMLKYLACCIPSIVNGIMYLLR